MALNDDTPRREPVIGRIDNRDAGDDTLLHDPVLGRLYAQAAIEEPPAPLDAAIQAAARREVGAGPGAAGGIVGTAGASGARGRRNWQVPLGLAAVVVLSVSLVNTIKHEKGDELARPPAAVTASPDTPPLPPVPSGIEQSQPVTPKEPAAGPPASAEAAASAPAGGSEGAVPDKGAIRPATGPREREAVRAAGRADGGTPWVDVPPAPSNAAPGAPRQVAPEMPARDALARGAREQRANKAAADSAEPEMAPPRAAARRDAAADLPLDGSLRPPPAPFPAARPAVPAAGAFSAPPAVSSEAPRAAGSSLGVRGFDRAPLADRPGMAPAPAAAPPTPTEAASRAFTPPGLAAKSAAGAVSQSPKPPWLAELDLQPPQKWLDKLAEFRRDGRAYDADMLLAEFRRRFPDYPAGGSHE